MYSFDHSLIPSFFLPSHLSRSLILPLFLGTNKPLHTIIPVHTHSCSLYHFWLFFFFTGRTTLTMTESKGLWQARAAAADKRTSRDSRAFSLGYHPVQAPRSVRTWKAGGRAAGKRGRRRCFLVHRRKERRSGGR